ncbi:MAG: class I SAM-dependent methyltransferase [Acidimicrobiales bacterium]
METVEEPQNRAFWNRISDGYQAEHGAQLDTRPLAWGAWAISESEVGALGPIAGRDILELGCGGGQWSLFLAEAGARPVGIDLSERQLEAARDRMRTRYPLVHGNARRLPFADSSFDIVLSDHGAMTWADPLGTVPEAARVLRPGGRLVFNSATPFRSVCGGADEDLPGTELTVDYFGLYREDEGDGAETFVLPYGEWIRLFGRHGLRVQDLIELRPAEDAETTYGTFTDLAWARRWAAEQIWVTVRE